MGLYPSFGIFANAVMIDASFVAERDGTLAGTALRFTHQEAAIDSRAEQVLGSVARNRPVIPRVFLQRIDGRHVVGRNPTDSARRRMSLAPFAALVVAQYLYLLSFISYLKEMRYNQSLFDNLYNNQFFM